jgi:hypothetical protein
MNLSCYEHYIFTACHKPSRRSTASEIVFKLTDVSIHTILLHPRFIKQVLFSCMLFAYYILIILVPYNVFLTFISLFLSSSPFLW